ncbi:hypothetical protein ACFQGT_00640 [Natrialbaceae archaeon GCM10025810]|uniref:hypothetical protein n=1 Tax=Halovalidus salilacus TaxID=3075124 RepID=UPI00361C145F
MTDTYADATTLIALGTIGELEVLASLEGPIVVLPTVRDEVTTEPARATVDRFLERDGVKSTPEPELRYDDRARKILGESESNGDVRLIAAVLSYVTADEPVGVVSDDRRVRTVARGLGATVTGTIGAIVTAVEAGLPADEAKGMVRRVDEHGLHMTAELRAKADELVDAAATDAVE